MLIVYFIFYLSFYRQRDVKESFDDSFQQGFISENLVGDFYRFGVQFLSLMFENLILLVRLKVIKFLDLIKVRNLYLLNLYIRKVIYLEWEICIEILFKL